MEREFAGENGDGAMGSDGLEHGFAGENGDGAMGSDGFEHGFAGENGDAAMGSAGLQFGENKIFVDEKAYKKSHRREIRQKAGLFDAFWVQLGLSMVLVICILVLNIVDSEYAAVLCEKFAAESNREFNLFTQAYGYVNEFLDTKV